MTEKFTISMSVEAAALLDARRGELSRSAFLSSLLGPGEGSSSSSANVSLSPECLSKCRRRAEAYELDVSSYVERVLSSAIDVRESWEGDGLAVPGELLELSKARELPRAKRRTV